MASQMRRMQITREEGQQLLQLALLMPLMLAMLGLVLDLGNVYVRHRRVQSATDAAAAAAATVLYQSGVTVASNTAYYYAAQHGYNNNGITNTVTIASPPTTGSYAGNSQYMQVRIRESVQPIFASMVWRGTFQVTAAATAGWRTARLGPSVLVLKLNGETFTMNGNNPSLTVRLGNVHVNSNSAGAVALGNGNVATQVRASIVGNYTTGPNGAFRDLNGDLQAPLTGASVKPDPLASLPAPSRTGVPTRSVPSKCGTLQPGIYPSGITTSSDCTLEPGVYILDGDFDIRGNARITGSGVFIYLAQGSIKLAGTTTTNLSAPTSGTYGGVLFFQARNNSATGNVNGTSSSNLRGTVYLPAGGLDLSGTVRTEANFVVNTLSVSGNSSFTVEGYDGVGWTTQTSALVE